MSENLTGTDGAIEQESAAAWLHASRLGNGGGEIEASGWMDEDLEAEVDLGQLLAGLGAAPIGPSGPAGEDAEAAPALAALIPIALQLAPILIQVLPVIAQTLPQLLQLLQAMGPPPGAATAGGKPAGKESAEAPFPNDWSPSKAVTEKLEAVGKRVEDALTQAVRELEPVLKRAVASGIRSLVCPPDGRPESEAEAPERAVGRAVPWSREDRVPDAAFLSGEGVEDPGIESAVGTAERRGSMEPEYAGATRFVPARFYRTPSAPRTVRRVVIHITDGGRSIEGTINWFRNPVERDGSYRQVSAHYVIGQDGEVVQMVRHQDVAFHARGANADSIGIEHVANTRGLVPTEAQYRASAELVRWICRQHGIPADRSHIVGHSEADPRTSHTGCPNSVWDWNRYMGLIAGAVPSSTAAPAPTEAAAGTERAVAAAGLPAWHRWVASGEYEWVE